MGCQGGSARPSASTVPVAGSTTVTPWSAASRERRARRDVSESVEGGSSTVRGPGGPLW